MSGVHKRPTLTDVAQLVGVTKMTVSRYLRNPKQVAAKTAERIQEVIDELGYVPSRAPDILSNAKSHAIGVLLPSLTNQVFAELLRGLESVTEVSGYQTMLAHYGYDPKIEERRIESLLSYNIDGLLLSDRIHTPRTERVIASAGIPVIEMVETDDPMNYPVVGFNNREAARQMVATMLASGYRQIIYLGARLDTRTKLKQQGYQQAMQEAGFEPHSVLTEQPSSFSLGSELLRKVLAQYPNCDGIFCTNDDLAVGAVFECQRQNIAIPKQLAIAGFHGLDIGQTLTPKLASVITPREAIGQKAAEQLLACLEKDIKPKPMTDLGFQIARGASI
ncbi:gluconate operon transcriptional repressor GntR [Celerinatantimonas diazotrophica]|uniref:LacI family transcriptional regulator n=1 Tax=Celerinatantimonas diazotrophica TaxID=412034 RepID=A0A4R1J7Z8_9GAMM|nr:gluconate operon transcriptional repressor GntR [Celerinatantimonas diazotrophica]TCK46683.1 LacI family transcriptional regulator [Celerinatantimonas diazotrophica]CAG9295385.1 HTH-type transcriptional regulator GntR [Celerinatantimonas diazotrophica]